jgi:hypothetical protein
MFCYFLRLPDGMQRKVKRCRVRLVGYLHPDLEGIGFKERKSNFEYLTSRLHSIAEALGAQPLVRDASRTCLIALREPHDRSRTLRAPFNT